MRIVSNGISIQPNQYKKSNNPHFGSSFEYTFSKDVGKHLEQIAKSTDIGLSGFLGKIKTFLNDVSQVLAKDGKDAKSKFHITSISVKTPQEILMERKGGKPYSALHGELSVDFAGKTIKDKFVGIHAQYNPKETSGKAIEFDPNELKKYNDRLVKAIEELPHVEEDAVVAQDFLARVK